MSKNISKKKQKKIINSEYFEEYKDRVIGHLINDIRDYYRRFIDIYNPSGGAEISDMCIKLDTLTDFISLGIEELDRYGGLPFDQRIAHMFINLREIPDINDWACHGIDFILSIEWLYSLDNKSDTIVKDYLTALGCDAGRFFDFTKYPDPEDDVYREKIVKQLTVYELYHDSIKK